MKIVKWWMSTGFAGCGHEGEFEIEETESQEEIEEMAKDAAFNDIDWGYSVEDA